MRPVLYSVQWHSNRNLCFCSYERYFGFSAGLSNEEKDGLLATVETSIGTWNSILEVIDCICTVFVLARCRGI